MINPNEVFVGPDGQAVVEAKPGVTGPVEVVLKDLIERSLLSSTESTPASVKLRRGKLLKRKIISAKKEFKFTSKDISLILEAAGGVLTTWAYTWLVEQIDPNQLSEENDTD